MDRDRLMAYLEQGLSLPQIGALEDRDPSTVGYWVKKYGLVANGKAKYAPRGGLTREQLEPLVETGSRLREIAAELDRSESTVSHWLSLHGLKLKGRQAIVPREKAEAALAEGRDTIRAKCPKHGETEFAVLGPRPRAQCKACRAEAVSRRRRKVKAILVEEAGGSCELCGYDRWLGSLQFHHRDPAQKAFAVSQRGITRALDQLRDEVAKCVLLCSNCHGEVEGGFVEVPPLESP